MEQINFIPSFKRGDIVRVQLPTGAVVTDAVAGSYVQRIELRPFHDDHIVEIIVLVTHGWVPAVAVSLIRPASFREQVADAKRPGKCKTITYDRDPAHWRGRVRIDVNQQKLQRLSAEEVKRAQAQAKRKATIKRKQLFFAAEAASQAALRANAAKVAAQLKDRNDRMERARYEEMDTDRFPKKRAFGL